MSHKPSNKTAGRKPLPYFLICWKEGFQLPVYINDPCSVKRGLMHLLKISTHIRLRSPHRLTWVEIFHYL